MRVVTREGLSLALDGGALVERGHGWQRQGGGGGPQGLQLPALPQVVLDEGAEGRPLAGLEDKLVRLHRAEQQRLLDGRPSATQHIHTLSGLFIIITLT